MRECPPSVRHWQHSGRPGPLRLGQGYATVLLSGRQCFDNCTIRYAGPSYRFGNRILIHSSLLEWPENEEKQEIWVLAIVGKQIQLTITALKGVHSHSMSKSWGLGTSRNWGYSSEQNRKKICIFGAYAQGRGWQGAYIDSLHQILDTETAGGLGYLEFPLSLWSKPLSPLQ